MWDEHKLQQFIDDEVQETFKLDYKRAAAFAKRDADKKKNEIAKDVTGFANAGGGTIVYGIAEEDDRPVHLDPIDKTEFSREWLDQVISSGTTPSLQYEIITVSLASDSSHVAYVVEIPQSQTAHQNIRDGRYYRRNNTTTDWMKDYEIRDVMNRGQRPQLRLHCDQRGDLPLIGATSGSAILNLLLINDSVNVAVDPIATIRMKYSKHIKIRVTPQCEPDSDDLNAFLLRSLKPLRCYKGVPVLLAPVPLDAEAGIAPTEVVEIKVEIHCDKMPRHESTIVIRLNVRSGEYCWNAYIQKEP